MSKYVFDFEMINKTIELIKDKSINMTNALNNYSSKNASSTASWQSKTKTEFNNMDKEQVDLLKQSITDLNSLSNYLSDVGNNIQSLEQELSNMKI